MVHSSSSPSYRSPNASPMFNPSHISRNGLLTIPARAISVHSNNHFSVLRPLHPLSIALLSVLSPLNAGRERWGPRDDSADTITRSRIRRIVPKRWTVVCLLPVLAPYGIRVAGRSRFTLELFLLVQFTLVNVIERTSILCSTFSRRI